MADPLSIASGVAGLVALCSKILAEGYHFIRVVEDCPRALRALLSETAAIDSILDQIQRLLTIATEQVQSQNQLSNRALASLLKLNALDDCRLLLKNVDVAVKRCKQVNGERFNNMRKRVIWPFQEREVKEMMTRLGSMREIFTAAISVDSAGSLLRIEKQVDDVAEDIRDSKRQRLALGEISGSIRETQLQIIRDDDEEQENKRFESILDRISPGNAESERHRDIRRQRSEGSGSWFFETYEWKRWLSGNQSLFWCRGNAGTGKTVITSTVRDHLGNADDRQNSAIAHFYFDYKNTINQNGDGVFSSVLKQLALQQPQLRSQIIHSLSERLDKGIPSQDDFVSTIILMGLNLTRVYLIFDALDECDDETQGYVLSSLRYIMTECQSVRCFITSRPHLAKASKFIQNTIKFDLVANQADIELLIKSRMEKCQDLSTEFLQEILGKLSRSADGIMLFVEFQLQYILEQPNMRRKRDALKFIPKDINAFYDQAMEKIRMQIDSRRELAYKVMRWIKYALRPLKIKELQEAVAIEENDRSIDEESLTHIDTIVNVCAGLVIIDYVSGTIRFLHYTVEQYLRAHPLIFLTTQHPQHQLASTCLIYLSFDWLAEKLPSSAVDPKFFDLLESHALLQYAVKYCHLHWYYYLNGSEQDPVTSLSHRYKKLFESQTRLQNIFQIFFLETEYQTTSLLFLPGSRFGKLHAASIWGLDDLVREYSCGNHDHLNTRDDYGRTAISFAVEYGWIEIVDYILATPGVDFNLPDNRNRSPIWWGARTRKEQSVRLLLEMPGIQPNQRDNDQMTPLLEAVMHGADGCVRALVDCPSVDPNLMDRHGRTPLWWACCIGREGLVKILLDHPDTNPDLEDEYGFTPLAQACRRGAETIVKILLNRNVNVNHEIHGMNGAVPLVMALLHESGSNIGVIKLLLDVPSIDVTVKDEWGQTALTYARNISNNEIVLLLTKRDEELAG